MILHLKYVGISDDMTKIKSHNKGWNGESGRHSLASRGIHSSSLYWDKPQTTVHEFEPGVGQTFRNWDAFEGDVESGISKRSQSPQHPISVVNNMLQEDTSWLGEDNYVYQMRDGVITAHKSSNPDKLFTYDDVYNRWNKMNLSSGRDMYGKIKQ